MGKPIKKTDETVDRRFVASRFNPTEAQLRRIRGQLEDGVMTTAQMATVWKTSVPVLREALGEEWWAKYITNRGGRWDMRKATAPKTFTPDHAWTFGKRTKGK